MSKVQILPVPDGAVALGSFEYGLALDNGPDTPGTSLRFRFTWRERVRGWYMDIEAADGTPIVSGERINPMSSWSFPAGSPPGVFIALGPDEYLQSDFGPSLRVLYMPPSEFPAARTPNRMTLS
jgi:hypothetical protein